MAPTAEESAYQVVTIRDDPSEVERIAGIVSSNEHIAACVHEYHLVTMSGDCSSPVWLLVAQTLHRLPNLKVLAIHDHGPAPFEAATSVNLFEDAPYRLLELRGNIPDTLNGFRQFLVKQDGIRKVEVDLVWNWQPSWFPQLTELTAPASVVPGAIMGRPITKVHVLHLADIGGLGAVISSLSKSTAPIEEFSVAGNHLIFNCDVLGSLARTAPHLRVLDKTMLRPDDVPEVLSSISAFKHLETVKFECPISLEPEEILPNLSGACPTIRTAHFYHTARYGQAATFILTDGKWVETY